MSNLGWPPVIRTPVAIPSNDAPLVLHLRSSGGLFGADRVVLDLCEALPSLGFRSLLVPLMEADGSGIELLREGEARGIRVSPLRLKHAWDLAGLSRLRHLARETGATLLHGHDYKSDIALWMAGKRWKRFATLHGNVGTSAMLRVKESLNRRVVNQFEGVFCVSEAQAASERYKGVRRVSLVRNGIDTGPFQKASSGREASRKALGIREGEAAVGAIGRLSEEKGYDFLLRVCARLLREGKDFKILLVGDGPQKQALQSLSRQLGIEPNLIMPGFRRDTASLYQVLDVFCMPSLREGLPLALLEAMASGRAILANAVGGIPEVLGTDGVCGHLMVPNDEETWTLALGSLLKNPEQRTALGASAMRKVETYFSRESMARGVARVYAETPPV